ncbi:MAG: hypothetical protein RSA52_06340 [Acetivibrio sp.]
MNAGKNKAPLLLMEQLIMIFVFSIVAVFCIQAFVFGGKISEEGRRREEAVHYAENLAEVLKANGGNLKGMEDDYWEMEMDSDYILTVERKKQDDYLGIAEITVKDSENKVLYRMKTAWQEDVYE